MVDVCADSGDGNKNAAASNTGSKKRPNIFRNPVMLSEYGRFRIAEEFRLGQEAWMGESNK